MKGIREPLVRPYEARAAVALLQQWPVTCRQIGKSEAFEDVHELVEALVSTALPDTFERAPQQAHGTPRRSAQHAPYLFRRHLLVQG